LSKKKSDKVERILEEKKAIKRSAELAKKGDVVVVICGDDHKKTVEYVQDYFKAKFV